MVIGTSLIRLYLYMQSHVLNLYGPLLGVPMDCYMIADLLRSRNKLYQPLFRLVPNTRDFVLLISMYGLNWIVLRQIIYLYSCLMIQSMNSLGTMLFIENFFSHLCGTFIIFDPVIHMLAYYVFISYL